jgi:hypothetical protein
MASNKPGSYLVRASHPDSAEVWEAPVIIGPAKIPDGRLRHWLVLGPFPDTDDTGLEKSQIPEATVTPSHNVSCEQLRWKSAYGENNYLDLAATCSPNQHVLAYAHVYILAPNDLNCNLVYGSDDGIRLWLNGELLQSLHVRRAPDPNQNTTPIALKAGWNRLLVKVDQMTGSWGFYMRLKSPDGAPLPELYYALDAP